MKNYLSLGGGVQSSTMALMASEGEIQPMPDAAIFADPQWEPAEVYRWLDWLEKLLPFPVYRVTYGNLGADVLKLHTSRKTGKVYTRTLIPLFVRDFEDGKKRGVLPRKCTRDYKVAVILREIKRQLGYRIVRKRDGVIATSWIGISRDEVIRMKPSLVPWVENRWPLVELGITRQGCKDWMRAHGYPEPPRSACVFCPFHNDEEWLRLQIEHPDDFAKAVAWEKAYQKLIQQDEVTKGTPFLHSSLVPLDQVQFYSGKKPQANLFGNECEGMCGV